MRSKAKLSFLLGTILFSFYTFFMPTLAFAKDVTQAVDSTMTVSMQTSSSEAETLTQTGDLLIWLVLALVVLALGICYVAVKARSLSVAGGHASFSDRQKSKIKLFSVGIITVVLAASFMCVFATKSFAEVPKFKSNITAESSVLVDENGDVISSDIVLTSERENEAKIDSINAPDGFEGWTSSLDGETVEAGAEIEGEWQGKSIPDDILKKLKENDGKYEISYSFNVTFDVSYNLGDLDIEADLDNIVYSATQKTPAVAIEGLVEGEDFEVEYGENTNAGEDAGTITVKGIGFWVGEQSVSFDILKKPITVEWTDTSFTYDTKAHIPSATVQDVCEGDVVTPTVTGGQINAGTYEALATIEEDNYQFAEEQKTEFVINPFEVELEWSDTELTYNAQPQKPSVVVTNAFEGDTVNTEVSGEKTDANTEDEPTYTAAASIDNPNYKLPEVATKDFTIARKQISVEWSETEFTYDTKLHAPKAAAKDVCEGDTVTPTVAGEQKNAGTYEATATINERNYEFAGAQKTEFVINPFEVELAWSDTELTYNAQPQKPHLVVTNAFEGDTVVAVVFGEETDANTEDIPTYTAVASIDNPNYKLPEVATKDFTIARKKISVAWSETEFTYDTKLHAPKAVAKDVCEGDTVTTTVAGEQKNAGMYEATATINERNYEFATDQRTKFKINPKSITVSWRDTSFPYDATPHKPTATANDVCTGDTVAVSVSGEQTNVGTYEATATINENNYVFSVAQTCLFSIGKKQITANVTATAKPKTYDATANVEITSINAMFDSLSGNDTLTIKSYSARFDDKTVGDKKSVTISDVVFEGDTLFNYDITKITQSECTAAISKRETRIDNGVTASSKTYDATASATIDISKAVLKDICSGDKVSLKTATGTFEDKNVGTNKKVNLSGLSLDGTDAENYTIASTGNQQPTATISAKALTVSWSNTSFVYDKTSHVPAASVNGVCEGDTVTPKIAGAQTNAGIYTATATISEKNYVFASEQSIQFKINPKPITVSWKDTSFAYDGNTHKPTATANDLCADDIVAVTVSGEQRNVGSYTATATIAENNYVFSTAQKCAFTIGKKQITANVAATAKAKTYDATTNVEITSINATFDTLSSGDTLTIKSYSAKFDDKTVGDKKSVTISDVVFEGSTLDNYDITKITQSVCTAAISKRETKVASGVTASNKTYDASSNATIDFSKAALSNVCTGDKVSLKTATGTFEDKNVGTNKKINLSGLSLDGTDASNYTIASTGNQQPTATISAKTLTVGWSNTSFVYDKTSHIPTATVSGVCTGDKVTPTVTGNQTNAGTYSATATINEKNYVFATAQSVQFKISPKPITVSWKDTSFPYDGTPHKPTATANDVCTGDTVVVSVSGEQTNVGNYTATATINEKNYILSSAQACSFSIGKRQLTANVVATAKSKTYDATTNVEITSINATFSGLSAGETLAIMSYSAKFDDKNVGDKKSVTISNVVFEGSTLSNYDVTKITQSACTAAITKRETKVASGVTASNKTYDGSTNATINISKAALSNICTGDKVSLKTATGTFEDKNAGTNKKINLSGLSLDGTDAGNYSIASSGNQQPTATISAKTLTVSWSNTSFVYDKVSHIPTATVSGVCTGDKVTPTLAGAQTNAGTYTATATINEKNYVFASAQSTQFKISPKTITVSWKNTSFTYDATAHKPTAIANNVCTDDSVDVNVSGEQKNVGSYTATATINEKNYVFAATQACSFTIAKKQITANVAAAAKNKTYDATTNVDISSINATFSTLSGSDVLTIKSYSAKFGDKNVGDKKAVTISNVVFEGSSLSNYDITKITQSACTATISKRETKVESGITASNKTYDGSTSATINISKAVLNNICAGDKVSLKTAIGAFEDKNVGTNKKITLSGLSLEGTDAGNYSIAATGNQQTSASITAKSLSVSWSNTSFVYDKTLHVPTATISSGVCDGDRDTVAVSVTEPKTNAGTYSATASITNQNYVLDSTKTTSFVISQLQISVSWGSDTSFVYDGATHVTSATPSGVLTGDTVTVVVSGAQKNAGSYTASATSLGGDSASNYKLPATTPTTKFTITKKSVGVNWSNTVLCHTGKELKPTASATGVISGDTVNVEVSGGQTNIGRYTATASSLSGASAGNYQLSNGLTTSFRIYYKYWMAPSYKITNSNNPDSGKVNADNSAYSSEESGIIKTPSQIEADVASIRSGNTSVINEYKNYMKEDKYHLYTVWFGSTYDCTTGYKEKNEYVEFRIIEVGSHDGDGSALTFQATHVLPKAYPYITALEGVSFLGAWPTSYLRSEMHKGSIWNSFPSQFTADIKSVSKRSMISRSSTVAVTSSDKLWIPSLVEIYSSGEEGYKGEGTQYSYYANLGISNTSAYNPSLRKLTRSNQLAENAFEAWVSNIPYWKLRSPALQQEQDRFLHIDGNGCVYDKLNLTTLTGVSPCFCF